MDKIINMAILAHVDAGKTTLTEQMLYQSGAIRTLGRVDFGNTQTDYLDVERARGISVKASETYIPFEGGHINIIDTPGHTDFAGEVERSFAAIDGAVLLVSSVEGLQSHTERIWEILRHHKIPTILFFNKIDRAGSHIKDIVEELQAISDCRIVPLNESVNEGEKNASICDVANPTLAMLEAAADYHDEAADAFLSDECPEEDTKRWFSECVKNGQIVPAFCGSALGGIGVKELLGAILTYLPSTNGESENEELSSVIFRIEHDKTMGRVAHVRMLSGTLSARDSVHYNQRPDIIDPREDEKITQIRKFNGQKYVDIGTAKSGDIVALCGLSEAKIYDSFGKLPLRNPVTLASPYLCVKATPTIPAKLPELVRALREMEAEDPLLSMKWEKSAREILLNITGKIQLEILEEELKKRYDLGVTFSAPSVIYKETPAKSVYAYADYTMPKPCWAVVKFLFEPLPRGSGVVYDGGKVPNNQLFYRYQEHIKRSFFESLAQGIYGWEATDFKATLVDGAHHTIHTHPLDFFVCTPMAVMNGFRDAGMTLLEPILSVHIKAEEQYLGKIIADITQMRGEFDTPVIRNGNLFLEARIPAATSLEYPVTLASMTGGRARFTSGLLGYKDCPLELGQTTEYRGICPLDRSKWILYKRGAITLET